MKHNIYILVFLSLFSQARYIEQTIFAYSDLPDIEVFYSRPNEVNENTEILFIIHGGSRDAEKYLKDWLPHAEDKNLIVISPLFTKEAFPFYGTLMMSDYDGKQIKDQSLYLDSIIGEIFDVFHAKFQLTGNTYRIYGHSGGAQFVHRYLLLSNDLRIDKAVMTNADFYTFLNNRYKYPFGLKGVNVDKERIEWFLRLKGGIFLAELDTERSFRKSRLARKQGKHRLSRGVNYFSSLVDFAELNQIPFRWRFEIVPDVSHDNIDMTKASANFILEDID